MNSILEELSKLRKGIPLTIDYQNSNRYRVLTIEQNGTHTAYYFTSPIYNHQTRKGVDLRFHRDGNAAYSTGSNATITVDENVRLENTEGTCMISLPERISRISETEIVCANERLYPTTNGIAIRSFCGEGEAYEFSVEISKPFLDVRANDKYFALMSEKFRPFMSVSCIGTANAKGNIISPAKISYQKISDREYSVSVAPCSSLGESVLFEVNLYEPKLFQDTTVESNNAKSNNAFGSIGFIGTTNEFGEQWLYSRPDFTRLSELFGQKILRATFHLPKLNDEAIELKASKVAARFCSFGSTWNNKIPEITAFSESKTTDHYIDLDLTPMLIDKHGRLLRGDGLILKAKKKKSGFSVIATGDNYLFPQILEINYR